MAMDIRLGLALGVCCCACGPGEAVGGGSMQFEGAWRYHDGLATCEPAGASASLRDFDVKVTRLSSGLLDFNADDKTCRLELAVEGMTAHLTRPQPCEIFRRITTTTATISKFDLLALSPDRLQNTASGTAWLSISETKVECERFAFEGGELLRADE